MTSESKKLNDGFLKLENEPPVSKVPTCLDRFDTILEKPLLSELKRIDLVLFHPKDEKKNDTSCNEPSCFRKNNTKLDNKLREIFEDKLRSEGFIFEEPEPNNKKNYKKLHCPFKRLCIEAERTHLEMPLLVIRVKESREVPSNFCLKFLYNTFVRDKSTSYTLSHKLMVESIHLFENHLDPQNFFRPSVRKLLVDHILKNINIKADDLVKYYSGDNLKELSKKDEDRCRIIRRDDLSDTEKERLMLETLELSEKDKVNVLFMEKVGLYTDKMILHEVSKDSKFHELNRNDTSRQHSENESKDKMSLDEQSKDSKGHELNRGDISLQDSENKSTDKMILDPVLKESKVHELNRDDTSLQDSVNKSTDKIVLDEVSKDSKVHELNRGDTSPQESENVSKENTSLCSGDSVKDPRKELNDKWTGFFQLQPMTKIRDYFGEKVAFYFAWAGFLVTTLWLPMLLGLGIFIYGIHKSASNQTESSRVFTEACDNDVTPFYALIICVWGTFFLKLWKRQTATLASQWGVDEFSATERERPEFYGTLRNDPVTEEKTLHYSLREQMKHFVVSGLTVVFMLCVVLASVIGVIVYRVFVSIDYCSSNTAEACVLATTIASSLLNTISILALSKLYNLLARQLTIWENHRTQTSFDNALIIKMFAFEFVNNYSSCFYIAFFRGRFGEEGILGLGGNYPDSCEPDGNCMSELSFQILILTICKPLPKFFTDIVLLWIRLLWIKRPKWCWNGQVGVKDKFTYIEIESLKPSLDDFTMEEYTEKIIQYGFLMLFAASLPLAPLIVIITNLIDIRIDAYRLLWLYRRPVAKRAQDIGIWYIILQFVNICGVISNGCLISLTSSWGRQYDDYTRLWIVVGFEHIVFSLQFMLAYLIPDVPSRVKLHSEKKKYRMSKEPKYDRHLLEDYLEKLKKRHEDEHKDDIPQGQVFTELSGSV